MSHEEITGCARKARYSTQQFALSIVYTWRKRGTRLRVYPCDFCKGFHVTSKGV